jgi:hypothetical protein
MRRISCPHCKRSFSEADEAWDRAFATGACPHCGKLLDPSKEAEASVSAAVDPAVQRAARAVRLGALALGLLCLVATAVLLLLGRLWYWLPLIAVVNFGVALFYNPQAEARNRMKRTTDLSRME